MCRSTAVCLTFRYASSAVWASESFFALNGSCNSSRLKLGSTGSFPRTTKSVSTFTRLVSLPPHCVISRLITSPSVAVAIHVEIAVDHEVVLDVGIVNEVGDDVAFGELRAQRLADHAGLAAGRADAGHLNRCLALGQIFIGCGIAHRGNAFDLVVHFE